MPNDHPHPVDKQVLAPLAVVTLTGGLIFLGISINEDMAGPATFWAVAAAVTLACFLILFALCWTAWLLREHHLWREGRRARDEA
jgi:hypothetical protein